MKYSCAWWSDVSFDVDHKFLNYLISEHDYEISSETIKFDLECSVTQGEIDFYYPGRRCLRYSLNRDFIGQNSKMDAHQKFFQNPKIYIWNMKKFEKNFFFFLAHPQYLGLKFFFKKTHNALSLVSLDHF